jgi:hypothetical protein
MKTVKTKAGKWYNNVGGKHPFIFLIYTPEIVIGLSFEPRDMIYLYRGVWITAAQEDKDLSPEARKVISNRLLLDATFL